MGHHHDIKRNLEPDVLERVRTICQPLPESEETIDGFGHTVFRVNGKPFVRLGESAEGISLSFKSDRETQQILVQQDGFLRTPYIGQHGWVSVKSPIDWSVLDGLIQEAYLRAAPKRLVSAFRL